MATGKCLHYCTYSYFSRYRFGEIKYITLITVALWDFQGRQTTKELGRVNVRRSYRSC